jgi:hypothetical protein
MERRRRISPRRLAGLLACAAVPALLATACSSGSSGSSGKDAASTPAVKPTTPAVAAAQFKNLPASCKTVTKATVSALVPKAKSSDGTETKSSDIGTRSGCSWTGNGSDGYQYRWLAVTLQRFDSSAQVGSAEDQAKKRFTDEVDALGKVHGVTTSTVSGVGDQASSVSGKATVSKVTSQNDTVVTRTGNVVLIIDFNGAGLEGKKNPSAKTVDGDAQRAAKDAVASVTSANAALGG